MSNWNILGEYTPGKDIVVSILESRGVKDIKDFLSAPSLNECFDKLPQDFKKSLSQARDIINQAIADGTHIIIFGDYDSDGINATAILYNFLKNEKGYKNISYFIPNRFEHSYGLSKGAIDDVLKEFEKGKKVLFITVDTGITALEEVSYIKKLGHKIVVTDHHQKPSKIPEADCLVWSDQMCGAAISWVLTKALGSKNLESIVFAAIATITDLQSVLGFNRVIVKKGLEIMNKNPPIGVKKLLEVSGIGDVEVGTYELGWVIGPRINASGRLKSSEDSVRLLIEKDGKVLEEIARNLDERNVERQNKTLEMYDIASDFDEQSLPKVIFSSSKDYHEGVIGIVASKLTQKYYRPSVVIALDGDHGKGSVRSIPGINIIEVLRKFEDLFVDLGGHPMAAGFTIEKEKIFRMQKDVEEYIKKEFKDDVFIPTIKIDLKIPPSLINEKILEDIERLKPFGMDNDQPVFMSESLGIVNCDVIGKDSSHLKMRLYDGDRYLKAVYFGGATHFKDLNVGGKIDLVYTLNKNEYNGNKYIDLVVKDFRKV